MLGAFFIMRQLLMLGLVKQRAGSMLLRRLRLSAGLHGHLDHSANAGHLHRLVANPCLPRQQQMAALAKDKNNTVPAQIAM